METQIRGVNEQLFGIVSKEAEDASSKSHSAKEKSEAADEKAGKAQEKANAAEDSATRASDKSTQANLAASGALSEAQQLRADLKTTDQELTDEHNKRMELEKSLTPRGPFAIRYEEGKPQLPDLTGFQDIKFDLVLIHDAEATRAGGAIIALLTAAGWTPGTTTFVEYGTPETPDDGVSVSWFLTPHLYNTRIPETKEIVRSWMRCEAAGLGLIVFLQDHDWEVQEGYIDLEHNVPNTVRIKIGFKPNPYFPPFKEFGKGFKNRYRERMQNAQRNLIENWEHPPVW